MAEKWMVDDAGTLINMETRDTYDYMEDIVDTLNKLSNENISLKLTYAKCRDCKHANEYVPDYAYPYIIPKCELNVKEIDYDTNACEDFQLCGRGGR